MVPEKRLYKGPYTDLLLECADELRGAGENAIQNLEGHLDHHLAECQRLGDTPNRNYVTSARETLSLLQS